MSRRIWIMGFCIVLVMACAYLAATAANEKDWPWATFYAFLALANAANYHHNKAQFRKERGRRR